MIVYRHCSKIGCSQPAVATLTYSHADQTAVLGPLSLQAEPHTYDLCQLHSDRLTAPRGWEIVRLALPDPGADPQGLTAVADAVSEPEEPEAPELSTEGLRPRSWLKPLSQPSAGQGGPADTGVVRPFRRSTPPERR